MTTLNDIANWNKGFTKSKDHNPIKKKLHLISNKTVLIIDESIINYLGIDKESTWVEEKVTDDGILLKICNKNVDTGGSSS
jgi:hypothetical protein